MLSIYTDQVFTIGTVAAVPQPVVVSNQLHNVPVSEDLELLAGQLLRHLPARYFLARPGAPVGSPHMFRYVVQRLGIMIPTLLLISFLVFVVIQAPPGDYLSTYIEELRSQGAAVDPARIAAIRAEYGLDKPFIVQYLTWVGGLLRGDMGYSFEYGLPVSQLVGDKLLLTMIVSIGTILFIWIVSFPIALYSATHQYSVGDYFASFLGFLGLATPSFLFALVLLYFTHIWFGISIGGLMDPALSRSALELGQGRVAAVAISGFPSSSSAPRAPPA